MAVWLSGSPAGHCLCVWWARRFGSGRHAWNMCGRNVGEFVPAQMEASCIQSDSWAVVSKTIWLWVSRPLSVHMIHGSSQGLMLVIGVSKCRGIHWCSNILLLYHLPGKVLGQPHLWCGVSVEHKNSHTLLGWDTWKLSKCHGHSFLLQNGHPGLEFHPLILAVEKEIRAWIVLGWDEDFWLPWIVVQRCTSSMVLACGRRRFKQSLEVIEARSFWI